MRYADRGEKCLLRQGVGRFLRTCVGDTQSRQARHIGHQAASLMGQRSGRISPRAIFPPLAFSIAMAVFGPGRLCPRATR